jgi:hypothetical protein
MIEVTGFMNDANTGQPITGGTIYAPDETGNPVAVARTDETGSFTTSVPDGTLKVMAVAPGYAATMIDPGEVANQDGIQLSPSSLSADESTGVVQNTTASAIPWWVWVAGAGILIYAVPDGKKKKKKDKISGDLSGYIIPVGIVVGGYLILKNLGLLGGGSSAQDANASAIAKTSAASVQNSLNAAAAAGDPVTLSSAQAAGIATSIFNAGTLSPVDQDTIQNGLIQANSLTDLLMIKQAFGTKQASAADSNMVTNFFNNLTGTYTTYDLDSFVRATLDVNHLATVNGYLSSQNINYQF